MVKKKKVQLGTLDTKDYNVNIRIKQLCPGCNLNKLEKRIIVCLKHSLPWIQRKAPLQSLGICRRCGQALYKLKADLENLGLSRKQVHQGLMQLATKPHVLLTRQLPYNRYRFKNLSKDERERNIIDNVRTSALNLRLGNEDVHKSNTMEKFIQKESKYVKKTDDVTACEDSLRRSNRQLFIQNKCYESKNPLAIMHSFDETLKQLDKSKSIPSKMRAGEKSSSKRPSVVVSMDSIRKPENNVVSSQKCDKDENHHCIHEHKHIRKIQEIPNLILDKVDSNRTLMFNKYKKNPTELNLNSCFDNKVSDSIKSGDYKKVDTNCIKSNIDKKLHNDKKTIDIKVNSIPDKNKYSKHKDGALNCTHLTEEVTKIKENIHEKLCKLIVSDKQKETVKKKRKLKDRFRRYFGDCISISEDEQEQNIIQKKFSKRRKKDSVDSCDSGVYIAERNISMTVACVDIIQKSNEDTSQGVIANVDISCKPNDDIFQGTIANVDIIQKSHEDTFQRIIANVDVNHKLNNDRSQGTIANFDIIHKSNKNTSQENIVNVDVIHQCHEDISRGIIANVDTSHESNENKSQDTIANIIQKSDEDTSQGAIVNVDTNYESNEDTSQGIIANADTSYESNENKSQDTIANIIQKSDEDTSQGAIVNVDTNYESNEDTSQGIIASVNTSHESSENTSQGTIANIIQKSDEDTSQGAIVNVDTNYESNEDTSQGIIANVDTSHESNEVTGYANTKITNQIKDVTKFMEIEYNNSQNNTYESKTRNTEIEKGELSRNKKFINISEKNNIDKSKHASSDTDISKITEQSEVNISIGKIKATTEINNILSSDIPEICIPNHDTITTNKNFSGSERSNLDIKDFNDLLHMSFFETCKITSNGNVLSIQEIVMNADVGENSNLKESSEIQNNCNQSVTEKVLNCIEEDKEVQSSFNTNKIDNVTSTNNISNIKNNENELAVENSELSISEKKDTQSNKLPQAKLRVLSSAELGSRWCPTPVNSVTSTVLQFSHKNTKTPTVPETIASITVPVSETVSRTTVSENMKKCYVGSTFSESVYVTLIKIRNLIQNIRISTTTNLNYDKLLSMEFEKLRNILNTDDFVDLTKGVIAILNKEMLLTPSLSLDELFCYAASVKYSYVHNLNKNKIIIDNLNECQSVKSVDVSNQITLNHNRCCTQVSQNIWASSVQSRLQYLLSISSKQSQTLGSNISPKQLQQNFQEQIVSPLQKNIFQSNVLINPTPVNNNNHNNDNMHQHNYEMQVHTNFTQQKVSNVNFAKQNSVTNMHARLGYPLQYSSSPSTERNQLGGVHISIPVTNASSINQQYVSSSVFIPQINTFCNVNVPNYIIQQNMNSTHMSQVPQLQAVSQSVSPNYNIPQPVQTTVATNISHSVPKNSRHIEQKHQKVIPQKRIPMEVPQNRTSKQVASSRQSKKSKLRQLKKKENLQVSLESTTNLFDILKYISDIQKLILLKQLDFYFSCTTWLQQQFTSEQWQEIHSQRSLLLYFQTLLKHLVEKTMKSLLPGKSQTNILTNIEIDVPKVIQITVKENKGICCQFEVPKGNQEQSNAMNIKRNCTYCKENLNVMTTKNQCEKEHEATDNSQTNNSSIKQNLQSHQTSDVDVYQETKVEKEPNTSRNISNSKTKEQNIVELEKIIENIPQIVEEKLSALSKMKLLNKDTLQQLNPHLVTVEISSKNDQVTVVDTNASSENTSKSEDSEKYQEHQHLQGTSYDDLTLSSSKSPNNIEYFNDEKLHNTLLEKPLTTYIKDVRSISMEAYLKIGVTNSVSANTSIEESIEEEEIKICLYCGKPSTVACIICLEAKYCSRECSQLHWEDHYKDCSPVERSVCL